MRLPKTGLVLALLLSVAAMAAGAPAFAADTERHGASLFGNLKYPPDFKHFDYVNVKAPKGGELRQAAIGTFDSLNPFIYKGVPAAGIGGIYDTLMAQSLDEPGAEYGLIAKSISYPDDFSSATFNAEAGSALSGRHAGHAEDVIWTFNALKKNHPAYAAYYANVKSAEKVGSDKVRFAFSTKGNRELR